MTSCNEGVISGTDTDDVKLLPANAGGNELKPALRKKNNVDERRATKAFGDDGILLQIRTLFVLFGVNGGVVDRQT